jgi:hypothetical protein
MAKIDPKYFTDKGRGDLIDEYTVMFDNLSTTQARCTQLLEENRQLRAKILGCNCHGEHK